MNLDNAVQSPGSYPLLTAASGSNGDQQVRQGERTDRLFGKWTDRLFGKWWQHEEMPEWWTALELLLITLYFPRNINIRMWLSAVDIHSGSHGKGLTPRTCKKYCLTCRIISSLVAEKVNFVGCIFLFMFVYIFLWLLNFQTDAISELTNWKPHKPVFGLKSYALTQLTVSSQTDVCLAL